MPTSARYPSGRSQHFTFFRRQLFQRVAATVPFLVLPKTSLVPYFGSHPLPKFSIGDLVASDWIDDEDEDATDFGEVVGLCYIPRHENFLRDRKGLLENSWAYYIYWTRSTHGPDISFPCFDGEPIAPDELRLVSHA